ncbi:hypothetical protein DRN46_03840 [Thermococci archaeon]|nr:MAG: hypothetical protein DRN46_03840 [Thermococci archaeon]
MFRFQSLKPDYSLAGLIREFLSSTRTNGVGLAIETRGMQPDERFLKLMQDLNIIHCVDLSKGRKTAVESDVLYSRLFGKGVHNIYQPTDES